MKTNTQHTILRISDELTKNNVLDESFDFSLLSDHYFHFLFEYETSEITEHFILQINGLNDFTNIQTARELLQYAYLNDLCVNYSHYKFPKELVIGEDYKVMEIKTNKLHNIRDSMDFDNI